VWEFKTSLASAERDDAADRIVRGNADRDPVARNHLDSEAAHPAAQLRKNLMALITLDPIQASAVHRNDGALHIDQIILAQALSFPNKDCAILGPKPQSEKGTLTFSLTRWAIRINNLA
jgi:hypothetical protein